MARLTGPDEATRLVLSRQGNSARLFPGAKATIYSDPAGTILADIQTLAGAAIPTAELTLDDQSYIPYFKFPDGVDTVYARITDLQGNVGPASLIRADSDARLDAIGTQLATLPGTYVAGAKVSTDGSHGLPAPSGTGLEFVFTASGLDDIRYDGVSQ